MNPTETLDTATAFMHRRAAMYDFARAFTAAALKDKETPEAAAAMRYKRAKEKAARAARRFKESARDNRNTLAAIDAARGKYIKANNELDAALAALLMRAARAVKSEMNAAKNDPQAACNMAFACLTIRTAQDLLTPQK